jgi:hypothetical protein
LANRSVVVVRVPQGVAVEARAGGTIAGPSVEIGARNDASWKEACRSWLDDQFNAHGEKLVGASCGVLNNFTDWTYQSTGRVFLRR